jgi:hypothetical protein
MALSQQIIDDIAFDAESLTRALIARGTFSQVATRELVAAAMPAITAWEAAQRRHSPDSGLVLASPADDLGLTGLAGGNPVCGNTWPSPGTGTNEQET